MYLLQSWKLRSPVSGTGRFVRACFLVHGQLTVFSLHPHTSEGVKKLSEVSSKGPDLHIKALFHDLINIFKASTSWSHHLEHKDFSIWILRIYIQFMAYVFFYFTFANNNHIKMTVYCYNMVPILAVITKSFRIWLIYQYNLIIHTHTHIFSMKNDNPHSFSYKK